MRAMPFPPTPALVLAALALAATGAAAQEVERVLTPMQDTSIFNGEPGSDGLGDGKGGRFGCPSSPAG